MKRIYFYDDKIISCLEENNIKDFLRINGEIDLCRVNNFQEVPLGGPIIIILPDVDEDEHWAAIEDFTSKSNAKKILLALEFCLEESVFKIIENYSEMKILTKTTFSSQSLLDTIKEIQN